MKKKVYCFVMFVVCICSYTMYGSDIVNENCPITNMNQFLNSVHFDSKSPRRYPPIPSKKQTLHHEDIEDGRSKNMRKDAILNILDKKTVSLEQYFQLYAVLPSQYKLREINRIAANFILPGSETFEKENLRLLFDAISLVPSKKQQSKYLKSLYNSLSVYNGPVQPSTTGVLMPIKKEMDSLRTQLDITNKV